MEIFEATDEQAGKKPELRELDQIKKERTTNPLAAFVAAPKKWRFETQEQEEKIVLVLRRHWVTNLGWILLALGGLFLPQFLLVFSSFEFAPLRFRVMGILVWYLLVGGYVIERFLDWFFNVFIITDERIVDFDFYGMIYKEISDAKIDKIEDVTFRQGSYLENMFDFGDVLIQTAAQIPQFEFYDVPQPVRVAKVLRELVTEEEIEKIEGRVR